MEYTLLMKIKYDAGDPRASKNGFKTGEIFYDEIPMVTTGNMIYRTDGLIDFKIHKMNINTALKYRESTSPKRNAL